MHRKGRVGRQVRLRSGPQFHRAWDKRRLQADRLCGPQITFVRCDHHDLLRTQTQESGCPQVCLRVWLIVLHQLG